MYEKILEIYAYLFAKPSFLRLNRFIFNLSIRGLGIQNYKNFKQTGESKLLGVVREIYGSGKKLTVLDVGANRGDYIELILDKCKDIPVQVFAFEPGLKPFEYLQSKYSKSNIHLFNVACSEKTGEHFFYTDGGTGEFSSLYSSVFEGSVKTRVKKTKTKTVRLDDIIRQQKLKKINLLKIDTEGSEFEILNGCQKAISDGAVDIIQFEFNSMNTVNKIFLKDFISLLSNYSLYRLLPNGVIKINVYDPLYWEIFSFQNFVAVRKDIVKKFEKYYAK